jgi:aldehyde dehydrogenase (NAD+)
LYGCFVVVCGICVVWKPSEKTPLTALATQAIFDRAARRFGDAPQGLAQILIGEREAGEALVDDKRVALVSATGSTRMGRAVAPRLAGRFARAILELGGNNGVIVTPSADLDLALRGVAFGAMGTAGQRCTTTRRLFLHDSIYDGFVAKLKTAYASVGVGNPLEGDVLVGPLIDRAAYEMMQDALDAARAAGGVVYGGERIGDGESFYVKPALVEMPGQVGPVLEETFAPILYIMRYDDLDAVMALHNDVAAGLSSAVFTTDMREAEHFLVMSDCGIANVNLGTSGAEIGGAFGGEKDTGGGRESGSDSWKAYMRRATNTVNYSDALPLAQGVSFDL